MSHNCGFVVLKYLFWNELTFLVTYDTIMNISPSKYKSTSFDKYFYGYIHNNKKASQKKRIKMRSIKQTKVNTSKRCTISKNMNFVISP